MSQPMDVDIQVAAPDKSAAHGVAKRAEGIGYRTSVYCDDEQEDVASGEPMWTCECTQRMVLTYDAIIAVQAELTAIAEPLGAYPDGWGTFGNAPAPAARPWWKFW